MLIYICDFFYYWIIVFLSDDEDDVCGHGKQIPVIIYFILVSPDEEFSDLFFYIFHFCNFLTTN